MKLIVLKGLPASGKTTYAEELVDNDNYVRINRDTIRLDKSVFPEGYNPKNRSHEKRAIRERDRLVIEALTNEQDIVVDDTNLNPIHVKRLANIAREHNAEFKIEDSFMRVPMQECIDRDSLRSNPVGQSVIRGMFHKWINGEPQWLKYDPSLPMAIICDIDGTLAHMNGKRGPFDWDKVGLDEIDVGIAHLLDSIACIDYAKVFLFSGRNGACRKETEKWLAKYDINYDLLSMRPEKMPDSDKENCLDDRIIKEDMLKKHIIGKYNVLFVIDDRPKVCRMWRDKFGLKVLNVGDPYFEF